MVKRFLPLWMVLLTVCLTGAGGQPVFAAGSDQQQTGDGYLDRSVCMLCHEAALASITGSKHWQADDNRTPSASTGCESCHGPGEQHVMEGGEDLSGLITFGPGAATPSTEQNALCLGCHQDRGMHHWPGSVHANEDVACSSCHTLHGKDRVLDRSSEAGICYECHQVVRSQFLKPYTHAVREQVISCRDCHQTHGSAGPAQLKGFTINETCTDCHAEKRGPFLWEHYPVSESCTLCHNAHGSIHPGILVKREPHLCQACHQPTGALARQHSRLALSYRGPGSTLPGPTGGTAGISRFVVGKSCEHCHVQVHGSNHPSGAALMR